MHTAVGRRYARALMEVVTAPAVSPQETKNPAKALEELQAINEMIAKSDDLHNALLSPAVSVPRKRAVLARLLEPFGASRAVRNFLFVVIDHRRIDELPSIVEAFEALLDERMGLVRADVASARLLTDAQKGTLETELSRLSGKRAKLTFLIDPSLIGGVVARIGSTVYDGSVRGQLEKLRVKLTKG
jgi:F-type H+-transporting ATPase subunit delta